MAHKGGETPSGGDYEVGYRKPPQHSRFKPGQSGNPRGREKGSLNLQTLVDKALRQKVTVKEQGKPRQITKAEVIATRIVNNAATSGDPRAIRLLMEIDRRRDVLPTDKGSAEQREQRFQKSNSQPGLDNVDFSKMPSAQLEVLLEALAILDENQERPPPPMPPADPGETEE